MLRAAYLIEWQHASSNQNWFINACAEQPKMVKKTYLELSRVMTKPVYAICEQQRRWSDCIYLLNPKFPDSMFRKLRARSESYLVGNPEDRFSHDEAQLDFAIKRTTFFGLSWSKLFNWIHVRGVLEMKLGLIINWATSRENPSLGLRPSKTQTNLHSQRS